MTVDPTTIAAVEALAATALDAADWRIFDAAELLDEALRASGLDARLGFASDLSTTLVIESEQFDVRWDARGGPVVEPF